MSLFDFKSAQFFRRYAPFHVSESYYTFIIFCVIFRLTSCISLCLRIFIAGKSNYTYGSRNIRGYKEACVLHQQEQLINWYQEKWKCKSYTISLEAVVFFSFFSFLTIFSLWIKNIFSFLIQNQSLFFYYNSEFSNDFYGNMIVGNLKLFDCFCVVW